MKHFIHLTDFSIDAIQSTLTKSLELKLKRAQTEQHLKGESWGLLFYKSSTRTRVSFEVGIHELGAHPIVLNSQSTQIERGESIKDTAKVLSRYLHGLVIRAYDHSVLTEFAEHASMPIVNGLTDFNHPCQILTDLFTLLERYDPQNVDLSQLQGRKIVFLGDTASNMANSWILAAAYLEFELVLAGPEAYPPQTSILEKLASEGLSPRHQFTQDAATAVESADALYTDVWVSMGDEAEAEKRKQVFQPFQVSDRLMAKAKKDAYFLHCLPAHIGEEVSQSVIEGPHSIVYDQAENRLHTQKAILAQLKK